LINIGEKLFPDDFIWLVREEKFTPIQEKKHREETINGKTRISAVLTENPSGRIQAHQKGMGRE